MKNRLCQNILQYDTNSALDVDYNGNIQSERYYCTTADLLNNSHLIRFGAIGDGSCLLHAIFTSNKVYYKASHHGKILFIHKIRQKLADRVRNMNIDQLFKYFSRVEWYLLMDGEDSVLKELADDYDISYSIIETLWQQAIVQIDKKKNISFSQIKKLILKIFHKSNKIKKEFLDELNLKMNEEADEMRDNFADLLENPGNWLGAPEYLFLCDQLNANFYILRFEQYGIVLGQESGKQYSAFINPKRKHNYIIAWNEAHYELVGLQKKQLILDFSFSSPIIKILVKLSSTPPRDLCKQYPLLSLFYNINENIPCQFLYPPKLLPKNQSPIEGALIFTKIIVNQLIEQGEKNNITTFLHELVKKYNKINISSFSVKNTSLWWKNTTIKNISACFSIAKSNIVLGKYAIQVDNNGKQLAIALFDIAKPSQLNKTYKLGISGKKNCAYIFNLCVPAINRKKGYCKLLMKEIYSLLKKNKISSSPRTTRRSSPRTTRRSSPRTTHRSSPRTTRRSPSRRLQRLRYYSSTKYRKKLRPRKSPRRKTLKKQNRYLRRSFRANSHISKKISCFYLEVYADNLGAIKCYSKFKKINTYEKNGKKVFLLELK